MDFFMYRGFDWWHTTRRRLRGNRPLQMLSVVMLVVFPAWCLFVLEYYNVQKLDMLTEFFAQRRGPALFALLVLYAVFALLLLLVRKGAVACGLLGAVSVIFAYINSMKVALNGDNFFPKDFFLAGELGEISSFVTVGPPEWFVLAAAATVFWVAALAVMGTGLPWDWKLRFPLALAGLLLCAIPFTATASATALLERFDLQVMDTALQSSNYEQNGFVSAFMLNLFTIHLEEPKDYSESYLAQLMEGYEAIPATNEEPFDVILVLSESFFDLRTLNGLDLSHNPLERYDELLTRENCYSGTFYSTALNGGTVRPEFEVLTGLTTDYLPGGSVPYEYVDREIEGYVSNYKDAGYTAVALHPYLKKFYSRDKAYPYLGYDAFYGEDEIVEMVDVDFRWNRISDASLERAIELCMDKAEGPMCLFAITMENHQPYSGELDEYSAVTVTSSVLNESLRRAVNIYAQRLYDADQMLGALADYVDSRARPTILVFFGDHKPNLGANLEAYIQTGVYDPEQWYDLENVKSLYSTPFVIYANRDISGGFFEGNRDNEITSYNLLNTVAVSTGFGRTAYMRALEELHRITPVYNVRLAQDLGAGLDRLVELQKQVTYDRIAGKGYSNG